MKDKVVKVFVKDETKDIFATAIRKLVDNKSLYKVTVTDIVNKSGMSRQTFYRHFKDKYDLITWYFEKLVLKSFREMGTGKSLKDALLLKFTIIKKEHGFFKEAFKFNDYNSLVTYDYKQIYKFYCTKIEKQNHSLNEELDFLLQMYCRGSIDMTVEWVLNDMPISIEKITTLLIESLPKKLEPFILYSIKAEDIDLILVK